MSRAPVQGVSAGTGCRSLRDPANGAITRDEARLAIYFVNFSPPFDILSGPLKAARSSGHYLQQPVAYCNSSLQSREDVFEFIIAAESASNLPLERRSVRAGSVCVHPQ